MGGVEEAVALYLRVGYEVARAKRPAWKPGAEFAREREKMLGKELP